jgi:hypothetical protein
MSLLRLLADEITKIPTTNIPVVKANDVLTNVINMVYVVGGITAVITIIIAGYMYVISGGNPAEVEKSKNAILYAVIGLIVIGAAFTLTNYVIGRF